MKLCLWCPHFSFGEAYSACCSEEENGQVYLACGKDRWVQAKAHVGGKVARLRFESWGFKFDGARVTGWELPGRVHE